MPRILFADDDKDLLEMLSQYLTNEGYEVVTALNGLDAEEKLADPACGIDLIILDVMMPKKSGFALLADIRRERTTPVLMLTARGDDADSILGLEMGADDYLAKPCNPEVLAARIRAILRRAELRDEGPTIAVNDLVLQVNARTVSCSGRSVSLTTAEFNILRVLLRNAGKVVSRDDLSEKALGRKVSRSDRTLDMHLSNLRQKLGPAADGGERIKTVWGVGYQYIT
jgi:two-component system response regulator CpxR